MRNRQRTPMVFSLSMIDMLCCGLGAVIFLMILYSWDARRQSRALTATRQRLERMSEHLGVTEQSLQAARDKLRMTQLALEQSEATIRGRNEELAALHALLEETKRHLLRRQEELSALKDEAGFLMLALAERDRETESLRRELAQKVESLRHETDRRTASEQKLAEARQMADQVPMLRQRLATVGERMKELEAEIAAGKRQMRDLQERLTTEEKRRAAAEEQVALMAKLRDELALANRKTTDLEAARSLLVKEKDQTAQRVTELQRLLEAARQENTVLQQRIKDEQAVAASLRRQAADAEGRFAGIDLTGKRVVLLVDKSGSMEYSEGTKPDPNKWPAVCRTTADVLRSLRQVEKFQVVLFSDQVAFPLGRPEDWHDFDPERSPQQVQDALMKVRPGGDTNLFLGFETAFRFKAKGMDAIYLFSDGLPNVGPGLPNPPPKDEAALTAALGRHVRDAIRRGWNARSPQVRIHAIGFYYDSPALGAFLWSLTRENGGSFVGLY
ncbi:MAG: VWA domain-containing protein [Gemmatales bacterium]|nr:VWA domain-containing protein [Gemmatales bacterium]MDW8386419.1 VWA domain-containing protein [Gemmatales bacterium]